MKKKNYSPYGTYGYEEIRAPKNKKKDEPKVSKTTGSSDLRVRGKK